MAERGVNARGLEASAPLGLAAGTIELREVTDRALASVAFGGDDQGARRRLERAFGVPLPDVGRSAVTERGEHLLRLQLDRLFVLFGSGATSEPERTLRERFAAAATSSDAPDDPGDRRARNEAATPADPNATATGAASDTVSDEGAGADDSLLYSSDQSDAWVMLSIDGPRSRRALERVCPLDLHPDVFPLGAVARSLVEHLNAIVLREGENAFLLLSPRSSARDFLHEIETSIRHLR